MHNLSKFAERNMLTIAQTMEAKYTKLPLDGRLAAHAIKSDLTPALGIGIKDCSLNTRLTMKQPDSTPLSATRLMQQ